MRGCPASAAWSIMEVEKGAGIGTCSSSHPQIQTGVSRTGGASASA